MMRAPESVKRFNSAKKRFLFGVLNNFFKQEFPKLLGPILRKKLVEELIKLLREFNKSPIMWCKKWSVRGVYGVILLAGDKLWGGDEFLRFYLVLWEADD